MDRKLQLRHPGERGLTPHVQLPRAKRAGIAPGLAVGLGAAGGLFFGHPVLGALAGLAYWWLRPD